MEKLIACDCRNRRLHDRAGTQRAESHVCGYAKTPIGTIACRDDCTGMTATQMRESHTASQAGRSATQLCSRAGAW